MSPTVHSRNWRPKVSREYNYGETERIIIIIIIIIIILYYYYYYYYITKIYRKI